MFGKSKKRKSLVVLIASSFWLFYVSLTFLQYKNSAESAAEVLISGRKTSLNFVISSATNALVNKNIQLLEKQMQQSRELFMIDFYILQENGKVVSFYNGSTTPKSLDVVYSRFNQVIETPELAFKSIKIFDSVLTVGIITNKQGIVKNIFMQDYGMIAKDITTVTAFLVALLYLYLKDIINLSKILSSRNRSESKNLRSFSKEGESLIKAVVGLESTQQTLHQENKHFSGVITPAILHEIQSGKSAPYGFESVMVRIDLNGYTQIFLNKREEFMTEMMNDYFTQAREVIERYGGLIYQYVGDEIVFHFKHSPEASRLMATSCIRSLMEVAQQIESAYASVNDHYFRIKASWTYGKMHFAHLDTGYCLSGLPLIETARLLNQIDNKEKSTMCFYADDYKIVSLLCSVEEKKAALLKGFSQEVQLFQTTEFFPVSDFLDTKHFDKVQYFRSDSDLVTICEYFTKNLSIESEKDFFTVYGYLKNLRAQRVQARVVTAYSMLLHTSLQKNKEQWLSNKVLSAIVTLCSHLIPTHQASSQILDLLNECLYHSDPRTCANAIIVLGDISKNNNFLQEFMMSTHNRVSADAMLMMGRKSIDAKLTDRLIEFVNSPNPLYKASGLYVVKELVNYYRLKDPVYFETNDHIQRLMALLEENSKRAA